MDSITFCQLFYAANNIPIVYYENGLLISAFGYSDLFTPNNHILRDLLAHDRPLAASESIDNSYYGLIRCPDNEAGCFLIGPVFATRLSDDSVRAFMHLNGIPAANREETLEYLSRLSSYTYHRFINILSFAYFSIYGTKPPLESLYSLGTDSSKENIAKKVSETAYDAREARTLHGTYALEQQIAAYVREGNVEKLEAFLLNTVKNTPLTEGVVGDTPLRQAKNIFLGQAAVIGKYAAIPAGLDIELTYQLIDQYSLECERLQTLSDITSLQYNMLIDFTKRISDSMTPSGLSKEIYNCIQYINSHVNEPISVNDVSGYINRSRSYTLSHFKNELGFNLGEYIIHAKIQEAKSLLTFTDKPLSEISSYLCFSSQSYFQNVFKKVTGDTPLEYRKKSQK